MDIETTPLDLNLFQVWDDDEDLWYKNLLVALVQGDQTPTQVAIEIDTYITQASIKQQAVHQQYLVHDKKTRTTSEENKDEEEELVGPPNPDVHILMIMQWVARLCTAFPPGHVGQDRIIAFLEALRALPRHEVVKASLPKAEGEPEDEEYVYGRLEMWPFGKEWLTVAEEFRYVEEEIIYRVYPGLPPPPTERDIRYRNSQSALARLTALGLVDFQLYSVLTMIIPSFHSWYPDLDNGQEEGFNWLTGYVIAGAQWIIQPDAGRYVYRECKKVARAVSVSPKLSWSMESWQQWKQQFAFVAGEERIGVRARELAQLAYQQMLALEREDEGSALVASA